VTVDLFRVLYNTAAAVRCWLLTRDVLLDFLKSQDAKFGTESPGRNELWVLFAFQRQYIQKRKKNNNEVLKSIYDIVQNCGHQSRI
jgi:hypothetical protein